MALQYISDNKGQTTGVYIPIDEWNDMKNKFAGLEAEEVNLPKWHQEELDKRLEDYKKNPDQVKDFDKAMDDIESEL